MKRKAARSKRTKAERRTPSPSAHAAQAARGAEVGHAGRRGAASGRSAAKHPAAAKAGSGPSGRSAKSPSGAHERATPTKQQRGRGGAGSAAAKLGLRGARAGDARDSKRAKRPKRAAEPKRRAPAPVIVPLLRGHVALVTGGSRGIGRAIAVALARAGADVAINYYAHRVDAEEVRKEIVRIGRRAITVQGDVANGSDARRIAEEVAARLAPIDILINNAGISQPQRLDRIGERDWDLIVDTNLKSVFLVTQAVLPSMRRERWGRIVNISSVAAQTGGIVGPHYAASKAGILGLTHSYASLLAKEGITVNAIAPALIETDMVRKNPKATPDRIPIGRFGTVDEVADVAAMLACNGYITGQTINVNGGWFMS